MDIHSDLTFPALRRHVTIFTPKKDEIDWRKLRAEGLHKLCPALSVIGMIKSVRVSRTCSTDENEEECMQGTSGKARRKKVTAALPYRSKFPSLGASGVNSVADVWVCLCRCRGARRDP
jgi:hypothetical protein